MSWDYSVVVRARGRTPDKLRELAARLAKSYDGELVADEHDEFADAADAADAADDEAESVDLHVVFERGGGTIEVRRLKRGYQLYVDSQRDGNRDSWEDIAGLAIDLAAKLGTVIDDEALAAEMIEQSEDAGDAERADANDAGAPGLREIAIVRVEARGGGLIRGAVGPGRRPAARGRRRGHVARRRAGRLSDPQRRRPLPRQGRAHRRDAARSSRRGVSPSSLVVRRLRRILGAEVEELELRSRRPRLASS